MKLSRVLLRFGPHAYVQVYSSVKICYAQQPKQEKLLLKARPDIGHSFRIPSFVMKARSGQHELRICVRSTCSQTV